MGGLRGYFATMSKASVCDEGEQTIPDSSTLLKSKRRKSGYFGREGVEIVMLFVLEKDGF